MKGQPFFHKTSDKKDDPVFSLILFSLYVRLSFGIFRSILYYAYK